MFRFDADPGGAVASESIKMRADIQGTWRHIVSKGVASLVTARTSHGIADSGLRMTEVAIAIYTHGSD